MIKFNVQAVTRDYFFPVWDAITSDHTKLIEVCSGTDSEMLTVIIAVAVVRAWIFTLRT